MFGALAHASDFIYMLQYYELPSRLSAYVSCLFRLDKRQGGQMQGSKDLFASGIPVVYSAEFHLEKLVSGFIHVRQSEILFL